jgi:hypothetical protein
MAASYFPTQLPVQYHNGAAARLVSLTSRRSLRSLVKFGSALVPGTK